MLPATSAKSKAKRRVSFPGICRFAAQENVSRVHVWRVLQGYRHSRRILAAWARFQSQN